MQIVEIYQHLWIESKLTSSMNYYYYCRRDKQINSRGDEKFNNLSKPVVVQTPSPSSLSFLNSYCIYLFKVSYSVTWQTFADFLFLSEEDVCNTSTCCTGVLNLFISRLTVHTSNRAKNRANEGFWFCLRILIKSESKVFLLPVGGGWLASIVDTKMLMVVADDVCYVPDFP